MNQVRLCVVALLTLSLTACQTDRQIKSTQAEQQQAQSAAATDNARVVTLQNQVNALNAQLASLPASDPQGPMLRQQLQTLNDRMVEANQKSFAEQQRADALQNEVNTLRANALAQGQAILDAGGKAAQATASAAGPWGIPITGAISILLGLGWGWLQKKYGKAEGATKTASNMLAAQVPAATETAADGHVVIDAPKFMALHAASGVGGNVSAAVVGA